MSWDDHTSQVILFAATIMSFPAMEESGDHGDVNKEIWLLFENGMSHNIPKLLQFKRLK